MAVVTHPAPGKRSYVYFVLALLFIKPLMKLWPITDRGLRPMGALSRLAYRKAKDVSGVVRQPDALGGRLTDHLRPAGALPIELTGRGDAAVLYLHGGAFIGCGPGTHREVAGRLARDAAIDLYALDYRQLPEAGVGTSVHDAVAAYRELFDRGYRHVVVAGDSAGGYLCGKVIEAAAREGLPQPAGFIGYSPLLDLDLAADPTSTSRHDAYLPKRKMAKLAPKFDRGPVLFRGARNINDVAADAFPTTLLFTAQDEFLEPDCVRLSQHISTAGVSATLHSYPWQLHAFPAMGGVTPQALEAIELSAAAIRDAVAAATAGDQTGLAEDAPQAG
ncbi:alpha/beta hydrolase [Jongsikchunia kroppenstedtii]|uniref:alpha/beta hydrolase n=1 Tax=Jongsikchunia kroppenstedtii TaxID=1121721 RepID=UPI000373C734|nr:alpha/beta hydrolase [Jongsikchunia kroppenstedtii]